MLVIPRSEDLVNVENMGIKTDGWKKKKVKWSIIP